MIFLASVWTVLAPLIAAQYVLATIALVVLARRDVSARAYVIWNISIVVIFFVGSIAFLIYNAARPRKKQ